ncbi:hypothetical protein BDZ88DRAFT_80564 [Geranomyces variabilis]|nr:hypothetical protein BDZ88DRAFT_80564 [Geranomyces variabilis]KAJ3134769.1 hypothetical protein HDU90_004799 [Geranomyces variabilis]
MLLASRPSSPATPATTTTTTTTTPTTLTITTTTTTTTTPTPSHAALPSPSAAALLMLADSPGDPARFSFCSAADVHFPDPPPPSLALPALPSSSTSTPTTPSIEHQLLSAWSGLSRGAPGGAPGGAPATTPLRLQQYAALENQRSVDSLKEIESRQRRLEELELAMEAFCADMAAAASAATTTAPTAPPTPLRIEIKKIHRVEYIDTESIASARSLTLSTASASEGEREREREGEGEGDSDVANDALSEDESLIESVLKSGERALSLLSSSSSPIPISSTQSHAHPQSLSKSLPAVSSFSLAAAAAAAAPPARGHARKVSLGMRDSLHWRSSTRSHVYESVPPVPNVATATATATAAATATATAAAAISIPAAAAVRLVSAEQLDQIDFEYSDLMHTPVPPQRTDVPPPTPTGVGSDSDDNEAASITVKKFHLPATSSKYMESLLMQINDPEVKMRLRILSDDRANAANSLIACATRDMNDSQLRSASTTGTTITSAAVSEIEQVAVEAPTTPVMMEQAVAPVVVEQALASTKFSAASPPPPIEVVKSPATSPKDLVSPTVIIPPRRHLQKKALEQAATAETNTAGQSSAAPAPLIATAAEPAKTLAAAREIPAFAPRAVLTPPTRRSSILPGAAAVAAAALEAAAAAAAEVPLPKPVSMAKPVSMPKPVSTPKPVPTPAPAPATPTTPATPGPMTIARSSLRAMPPRLYIPPPPTTPPPTLLTRMGVFQTTPVAAHRPQTLGRRWGDPMNSTSFVTPPHVAPERATVPIERVSGPTLLNTSWRGATIPIQDVLRELSSAGRIDASSSGSYKGGEYRHGWGSLKTVLRPKKSRPDLASVVFESPTAGSSPTQSSGMRIPTPTSPAQRSATVYPSPPSSPPKPARHTTAAVAPTATPVPSSQRVTAAPPPASRGVSRGFGTLARKMGLVLRLPSEQPAARIPATIPEEGPAVVVPTIITTTATTTPTTTTDYLSTNLGSIIPSPGTWDFVPPPMMMMQQEAAAPPPPSSSSLSPPRRRTGNGNNNNNNNGGNNNKTSGRLYPPAPPKQTTVRAKNRSSEMEEFRMMLLETYGTKNAGGGGRGLDATAM